MIRLKCRSKKPPIGPLVRYFRQTLFFLSQIRSNTLQKPASRRSSSPAAACETRRSSTLAINTASQWSSQATGISATKFLAAVAMGKVECGPSVWRLTLRNLGWGALKIRSFEDSLPWGFVALGILSVKDSHLRGSSHRKGSDDPLRLSFGLLSLARSPCRLKSLTKTGFRLTMRSVADATIRIRDRVPLQRFEVVLKLACSLTSPESPGFGRLKQSALATPVTELLQMTAA